MSRIIAATGPFLTDFCEDFIVSDTLPGTTHPDDNHDRPWWGLPCTVTPCFGARLVQEGNRFITLQTAPVSEAGSAMQMHTTWTRPFRC